MGKISKNLYLITTRTTIIQLVGMRTRIQKCSECEGSTFLIGLKQEVIFLIFQIHLFFHPVLSKKQQQLYLLLPLQMEKGRVLISSWSPPLFVLFLGMWLQKGGTKFFIIFQLLVVQQGQKNNGINPHHNYTAGFTKESNDFETTI